MQRLPGADKNHSGLGRQPTIDHNIEPSKRKGNSTLYSVTGNFVIMGRSWDVFFESWCNTCEDHHTYLIVACRRTPRARYNWYLTAHHLPRKHRWTYVRSFNRPFCAARTKKKKRRVTDQSEDLAWDEWGPVRQARETPVPSW